ncbi:MAG TPA: 50S ribosomal protein L24 [Chloroflexota bacterium]|nr:50S ribosomal protein L24 [Chloroflexota bacterium]
MPAKMTKAERRTWKRSGFDGRRKSAPSVTVKKGDTVQLMTGADTGSRGQVLQVLRAENRVIVENVRLVTRHQRRRPGVLQSETVEKPAPVHRSNVMVVCPNCDRPTRIAHTTLPDGARVRSCKHCGEILDKGE